MDFLEKLRKKSDQEKKIIIWTALAVIGLIFLIMWIYVFRSNVREFKKEDLLEEIKLPSSNDMPKMEDTSEEDLKALQELMNQLEQENVQQ